jgi:hypothetical protein
MTIRGRSIVVLAYLTFGQTKLKMRMSTHSAPIACTTVSGVRLPGPGTERGEAGYPGQDDDSDG